MEVSSPTRGGISELFTVPLGPIFPLFVPENVLARSGQIKVSSWWPLEIHQDVAVPNHQYLLRRNSVEKMMELFPLISPA